MKKIEVAFGEVLRDLRESKTMTLSEFAGLAGLDRSTVSKMEKGQITPTIRVIFKIAKGHNVSPSSIIKKLEKADVSIE